MLFVGIDIAKRNHEASVIAQDGRVVRKAMRFANSQASYNKFMDMVRSLKEPVVFGMEATGHYWLTLYTHLRNDGFTVHVINPILSYFLGNVDHYLKEKTVPMTLISSLPPLT